MHEYIPFAVTLLAIFAGILLNRNDVKELRAEFRSEGKEFRLQFSSEIAELRNELRSFRAETNVRLTKIQDDLNGFHRSLGQHDKAIEVLEKKR